MAVSLHSDLYKGRNSNELFDHKQSERRQQLLTEQKQHRSDKQDESRNIEQFLKTLQRKVNNKKPQNPLFKNYVQLSEWLHERPDDLDKWFMVPCPKGRRCIAVATNGSTKIYNKHGVFLTEFRSGLPGDIRMKNAITILDCFSVTSNEVTKYMVVDVMYYSNTEMLNCETSFRFFWIGGKLSELDLDTVNPHNEFSFIPMKYVDCGDEIAVDTCLSTYPMWENDANINLDGLLFYHKDSFYVHGTTPLVGWLFSFMVNEVLGFRMINPKYLEMRPANYINAATYIEDFEKARMEKNNKENKGKKTGAEKMEEEPDEDGETLDSLLNAERNLEVAGRRYEDIYFDTMGEN